MKWFYSTPCCCPTATSAGAGAKPRIMALTSAFFRNGFTEDSRSWIHTGGSPEFDNLFLRACCLQRLLSQICLSMYLPRVVAISGAGTHCMGVVHGEGGLYDCGCSWVLSKQLTAVCGFETRLR